jgi:hypothetical protein
MWYNISEKEHRLLQALHYTKLFLAVCKGRQADNTYLGAAAVRGACRADMAYPASYYALDHENMSQVRSYQS